MFAVAKVKNHFFISPLQALQRDLPFCPKPTKIFIQNNYVLLFGRNLVRVKVISEYYRIVPYNKIDNYKVPKFQSSKSSRKFLKKKKVFFL